MANNTGMKFGGRKKGTPNRTTKETREAIKLIIDDELEELPLILKQMRPYHRADILIKLIQMVIPKPEQEAEKADSLQQVKIIAAFGTPLNIEKNV
jgi:hypothetical protein